MKNIGFSKQKLFVLGAVVLIIASAFYYSLSVSRAQTKNLSGRGTVAAASFVSVPSDYAAYWKFENNTTDETNHFNGTNHGGSFVAGREGSAIHLNGVNNYIDIGNFSRLDTFTLSAWVKASWPTVQGAYTGLIFNGGGGNGWGLAIINGNVVTRLSNGQSYNWSIEPFIQSNYDGWHLLTVTAEKISDTQTRLNFYRDGGLFTKSAVVDKVNTPLVLPLSIGRWDGAGYFAGDLDNILIYNRALTAAEVTSIYDAATNRPPVAQPQSVTTNQDTALPITLSATDFEEAEMTYSVVTQPAHGSLAGTAPAVIYTPQPGYTGSDSFTFKANDGSADSDPATISITIVSVTTGIPAGYTGYWKFEGDARDEANHLNGTDYGANLSAGNQGAGLRLDGDGDYIDLGNVTRPDTFTFSIWVKAAWPTAQGANTGLIFGSGGGNGWGLAIINNKIVVRLSNGQSYNWTTNETFDQTNYDGWHLLTVTAEKISPTQTSLKYYKNGILIKSGTADKVNSLVSLPLSIGRWDGAGHFAGDLDNVLIYTRSLSASEIKSIYDTQSLNDPGQWQGLADFCTQTGKLCYDDTSWSQYRAYPTIESAYTDWKPGSTLYLKEGIYRQTVTVNTNGQAGLPVTLAPYPGDEGKVIVEGSDEVSGWRKYDAALDGKAISPTNRNNVYVKENIVFSGSQIFQDGIKLTQSRWPEQESTFYFPTALAGTGEDVKKVFYDAVHKSEISLWNSGIVAHVRDDYFNISHIPVSTFDPSTGKITLAYPVSGNSKTGGVSKEFGYYLTNVVAKINNEGQWAYDSATKKLFVWPKGGTIDGSVFEASSRDYGVVVNDNKGYINIQGLTVERNNATGIYLRGGSHDVTVSNNIVDHSYMNGIDSLGASNNHILGNTVQHAGAYGIYSRITTNIEVKNNNVFSIGAEYSGNDPAAWLGRDLVSGRKDDSDPNRWNSGQGIGIYVGPAQNAVISNNRVDRTGQSGIYIAEQKKRNRTVSYNYITNAALSLDDTGAIYNNGSTGSIDEYDVIDHNTIDNVWGFFGGTPRAGQPQETHSQAVGIYIDEGSDDLSRNWKITNNIIMNAYGYGINAHDANNLEITDNVFYSNKQSQLFIKDRLQKVNDYPIVGYKINNNLFFATTAGQKTLNVQAPDYAALPDFITSASNNYYSHVSAQHIFSKTKTEDRSVNLNDWRQYYLNLFGKNVENGSFEL